MTPTDCAYWEVIVTAAQVSELPEEEDPPQAVMDASLADAINTANAFFFIIVITVTYRKYSLSFLTYIMINTFV